MYRLHENLFGRPDTVMLLGDETTFLYISRNISGIIDKQLNESTYDCVAIGGRVPPASLNDTILYNIDFSALGEGVKVSSIYTINKL